MKKTDPTMLLDELMDSTPEPDASKRLDEQIRAYETRMQELMTGPARPAVFLCHMKGNGGHDRALCVFEDGTEAMPVIIDPALARRLEAGDQVVVDNRATAVLGLDGARLPTGETVRFERQVSEHLVEVSSRDEHLVLHCARRLRRQITAGEVRPGASLVVNIRQKVAFADLPGADDLSYFRFLDRSPVPDIVASRDIGGPPALIEDCLQHVQQELLQPEVRRRYGLPRSMFHLLVGSTGTGKTLSINAIIRGIGELMAWALGVPLDQVPPRVVRFRPDQLLSPWLGTSDSNVARCFDEIIQLAKTPHLTNDGRAVHLPVLVIGEEIEGLGRHRGTDHDGVYDRILTTFLQRLDPARPEFKDHTIVCLFTSNAPHLLDAAMLRRCGMRTHRFARLAKRQAFQAVMDKQLQRLPLAGPDPAGELKRVCVLELASWLYAVENQEAVVELLYVGSGEAVPKFRRDFLTPALLNRAVIQAAEQACRRETGSTGPQGATVTELKEAIDQQVRDLVEQLTEANVREYLDLPDGLRVGTVRRIRPPFVARHAALRAAV
ncbi:MAG: ATP-binding protein [Verrucomicrobia bacterium]|nr:ATP-binding protein [Verrucomicrobiota bacterium]